MILDRYLTREIIPNFLIGLLVFTFVLLMNLILQLAETLITRGVGIIYLFLIIFYSLPALTVLTIPMSLLLGILLGLGRLGGDSELTVMRASGISIYRLMIPILLLAAVGWGVCSYLIQSAVPWGNYSLSQLTFKIITTNPTSELKPRMFYNQFPGMVLYVQDIPSTNDIWKGVFIYDERQPDKPRLLLAKEGHVLKKNDQGEIELELKEGSWHEVDPRNPQDYTYANFLLNILPLPTPPQFSTSKLPKGEREQTVAELRDTMKDYHSKKIPIHSLEVEIQKKYAIPFACVVFSFLALTMGFTSKKGSRSSAYAISIGIILIYYIFLIGGERFGDAGTIPPWLAAWAGNIVLGLMGIVLFLHSNTNTLMRGIRSLRFSLWKKTMTSMLQTKQKEKRRIVVRIRIQRFPWRFFTLLDRYVVTEFIRNFVLILVALTLIAELIEGTQKVDDLFRNKVSVQVLFLYLRAIFPQWIFYCLPVTALTTTLVTFGSLTKNSEVIAMKSSGVSLYRIALPVIIVACLLSGIAFWLQDYILPYTNKIANNYKRQLKGQPPEMSSTFERHWISGSDGFYNYDLYDVNKNHIYGFSIYQINMENFAMQKRIYSRQATYRGNAWTLKQGWQRTFQRGRMKYDPFQQERLKLPVNAEYFRTEQELPAEMRFTELQQYIVKMKERGFGFVRFAVDLQAKISFPCVSLILTLIAIPFSFTTGKRGALYGIGLSIVTGIIFWFFLAFTKSLGYLEILGPFLAAWTPNILATLIALYLLFRLRT